jgi:hypothetical protein
VVGEGDVNLECRDCGYSFLFTVGEQEFYRAKDFEGPPTRCKPCRAQKKASRDSHRQGGGDAGFGGQVNYMMMDAYGNPVNMFPYQQQQRPNSNLRTKPCHAFRRGECTYGAECRYYHDDGSQGPPGQYQQQQAMGGGFPGGFPPGGGMYLGGDPGGMFMRMPPPGSQQQQGGGGNYSPRNGGGGQHRGQKSNNPCFAFQRGECTYGDSCRYQHVDAASSMTDASGRPIAVHPHLPRGYCHAFARGECKYGDTCKFRHEIPAGFTQGGLNPNPNMS